MSNFKLSATAISDFLRSPKYYYWRNVFSVEPGTRGIEPVMLSSERYDHDRLFGQAWAAFVHRFYTEPNISLDTNRDTMLSTYAEMTHEWLDTRYSKPHLEAMRHLAESYYEQFSPHDGARTANGSELWLENETFCARLDGLSEDGIVHECKATSHALSLSQQLYKHQNSIQAKLYCVLADAKGILVELAFKDKPYAVYRAPILLVSEDNKIRWYNEIMSLAHRIRNMGLFPCHPEGCNYAGKRSTTICPYQGLCSRHMNELSDFKPRVRLHERPSDSSETCAADTQGR